MSKYLRHFRASDARQGLGQAARAHIPLFIKSFIENTGYTSPEPADSPTSMTAYAARLAIDIYTAQLADVEESKKLERLLHRFVKTHLIPALKTCKPSKQSPLRGDSGDCGAFREGL
ncbi:MAG: hypothetical protein QXF51_01130 [Nitrososphaerota archaeon]